MRRAASVGCAVSTSCSETRCRAPPAHAVEPRERLVERLRHDPLLARVGAPAADPVLLLGDVRELEVERERPQHARLPLERQRRRPRPRGRRAARRRAPPARAPHALDVREERLVLLLDEHLPEQVAEHANVAPERRIGRDVADGHAASVGRNRPENRTIGCARCEARASVEAWVRRSWTRSGRATSRGARTGSPTCSTSTSTSCTRSPRRRRSSRCASPAGAVRRPDLTLATMDHNVATGDDTPMDPLSEQQLAALARNCEEFGVPLYATGSGREGIVHVIGPELGADAAGHDDRLRRLAHLDARRARRARVRDRHLRGRARARDADAAAAQAALAPHPLRRRAARRRRREGHRARRDRPARRRRRRRPRDRVRGARDRGPLDGGAAYDLQHVDRGGRARRLDRAGRRHVRVSRGPAGRAEGRRLGRGGGALARACERRRRGVRPRARDRRLRAPAAGDLGDEPGHGRAARRRRSRSGGHRRRRRACSRRARARVHGARARARRCRRSRSIASSSAPARTRASRTCASPPRSCGGGTCIRPCARSSCPGRRR